MTSDDTFCEPATNRQGICPACGEAGTFQLLGKQNWPPKVAERLGVPETVLLYLCPNCHSTISESAIQPPPEI